MTVNVILARQRHRTTSTRTIFKRVGVDYAGPEANRCESILFVSLTVKAELVSNLTIEAFIATLCSFIGRRGLPMLILSDHETNFVGADRHLFQFLTQSDNYLRILCITDD